MSLKAPHFELSDTAMAEIPFLAPALDQSVSARRIITGQAMRVFAGWGYKEAQVPLIDYFDTIKRGLDQDAIERSFRFVDRSGNVMMIRTDVTPAIAKMAAYQLSSGHTHPPLRISYASKIVRLDRSAQRSALENYQLGVELIGVPGLLGEIEVFLIALESLEKLGVPDFQFNVTDHGIARHLITATGAPNRIRESVHEAIVARDPSGVRRILKRLGTRERFVDAVAKLADFEGGLHQLAEIQELIPEDQNLHKRLDNLRHLLATLSALGYRKHIRLDMAELAGASYYTGIAFNIVSESAGRSLGRGGRYDDLVGVFGPRLPAAGFSLTSEAVVDSVPVAMLHAQQVKGAEEAVIISEEDMIGGFQKAISRRQDGQSARIVRGADR